MSLAQPDRTQTHTEEHNTQDALLYTQDRHSEVQSFPRGRTQLKRRMLDPKGAEIGRIELLVVHDAPCTTHEAKYIWMSKLDIPTSGVFIQQLVMHRKKGREERGAILFDQVRAFARGLGLHVYCHTKAANVNMRSFLRAEGCQENIFWFTKNGTLMVRYMLL